MTVIVNNLKIRIFKGATVGDVLLRYLVRNGLDLNNISVYEVADKWGHKLDNSAPLSERQIIKITNL